jgi:hypothetical protein
MKKFGSNFSPTAAAHSKYNQVLVSPVSLIKFIGATRAATAITVA